jgi:hypothetical protein
VEIGGDLGLAYRNAGPPAAVGLPVSRDQPHLVASIRRVQLGFVKQLSAEQPYLSELLDATKCAKITPC